MGEGRRESHKRKWRGKKIDTFPAPLSQTRPCGHTHPLLPQCRKVNHPCPQPSNRNRGSRDSVGRSSRLFQRGVPGARHGAFIEALLTSKVRRRARIPREAWAGKTVEKSRGQKRKDKQRHPLQKASPPLPNVAACALGPADQSLVFMCPEPVSKVTLRSLLFPGACYFSCFLVSYFFHFDFSLSIVTSSVT